MDLLAHLRPRICTACEYDLTGLAEPRCPECGLTFDAADIVLRGWPEERLRRPLWLRALDTGATILVAAAVAQGCLFAMWRFDFLEANPLALCAVIVGAGIATHTLIAVRFSHCIASPTIFAHIGTSGVAIHLGGRAQAPLNFKPWSELTGASIKRAFLRRGLYRLRFRHRRKMDDLVAHRVYFDSDETTALALHALIARLGK